MIEVIIKQYLDQVLDVPIQMEHQENEPDSFVIFEKTGSSKQNHLRGAVFAFQSYGKSLYQAALLNEKVKEAIEGMIELDAVSGIHLNADYNFTDVDTKRYRYQAVFNINYF